MSTPTKELATQPEVLEGEIVQEVDFDPDFQGEYETDWTNDQALAATRHIEKTAREFRESFEELIFDAYVHRVWIGYGVDSWEEWRNLLKIPMPYTTKDERKRLGAKLKKRGLSTRAIGVALEVGKSTVDRDVREAEAEDQLSQGGTHEDTDTEESEKILGVNGKEYSRDRKKPAAKRTPRRTKAQIEKDELICGIRTTALTPNDEWKIATAEVVLRDVTRLLELMKEEKKS